MERDSLRVQRDQLTRELRAREIEQRARQELVVKSADLQDLKQKLAEAKASGKP